MSAPRPTGSRKSIKSNAARKAFLIALRDRCQAFFADLRRNRSKLAACRMGDGGPIEKFVHHWK